MVTKKNVEVSKKLKTLIEKINVSHQQCLKSLRAAVPHARRAGTYLLEVQGLVEEGEWIAWVQDNCRFSVSEAQRYKRIADRYGELLEKCDDPANLTLTEALRLLSPGKDKAGDKETSKPLVVTSAHELKERLHDAENIEFPADSRAKKFIEAKTASLARQIIRLATKAKIKDEIGNNVEAIDVAIALIQQLKDALDISTVVKVREPKAASHTANGYKPHNRLNGRAKIPA